MAITLRLGQFETEIEGRVLEHFLNAQEGDYIQSDDIPGAAFGLVKDIRASTQNDGALKTLLSFEFDKPKTKPVPLNIKELAENVLMQLNIGSEYIDIKNTDAAKVLSSIPVHGYVKYENRLLRVKNRRLIYEPSFIMWVVHAEEKPR